CPRIILTTHEGTTMDRALLADFLRTRRKAVQPEDVGLIRGDRRRTNGLRREEVADLSGVSADYYTRIEQQRGPMPSGQILAALARGLRLNSSERKHLFQLGGFTAPREAGQRDEVSPTMLRIIERMSDTPVVLFSQLGEALAQNALATSLLGDYTRLTGLERYFVYRWFTGDSMLRDLFPIEDHTQRGRVFIAEIREAHTLNPNGPAREIVDALIALSAEFRHMWQLHEVGVVHHRELKRYWHAELGELEMYCQLLVEPDDSHVLHIFTAPPGSPTEEKLRRLTVMTRS
ncbi:MAG: Helix-turn-helix protein, partial [Glaciihabitans sp.]|nr:Helix-turn-helix protein [Glaciihabitans sp.]